MSSLCRRETAFFCSFSLTPKTITFGLSVWITGQRLIPAFARIPVISERIPTWFIFSHPTNISVCEVCSTLTSESSSSSHILSSCLSFSQTVSNLLFSSEIHSFLFTEIIRLILVASEESSIIEHPWFARNQVTNAKYPSRFMWYEWIRTFWTRRDWTNSIHFGGFSGHCIVMTVHIPLSV